MHALSSFLNGLYEGLTLFQKNARIFSCCSLQVQHLISEYWQNIFRNVPICFYAIFRIICCFFTMMFKLFHILMTFKFLMFRNLAEQTQSEISQIVGLIFTLF